MCPVRLVLSSLVLQCSILPVISRSGLVKGKHGFDQQDATILICREEALVRRRCLWICVDVPDDPNVALSFVWRCGRGNKAQTPSAWGVPKCNWGKVDDTGLDAWIEQEVKCVRAAGLRSGLRG